MKGWSLTGIAGCLFSAALSTAALAQTAPVTVMPTADANEWTTWGYDEERTGWNRAEKTLSTANVSRLRVAWKSQLSTPRSDIVLSTLTAPLVAAGVPTAAGPKDIVYTLGADDTLFAIDAASGREIWRKAFTNAFASKKQATWLCPNTANATPVIDKKRGLIFVLANDGRLRALSLGDGAERMAPTEMTLPFARVWSLNIIDNVVYTTGGRACGEIQDMRSTWAAAATLIPQREGLPPPVQTDPSQVTAIDTNDLAKPETTRFFTSSGRPAGPWGRGGVVRGPENSVIVMTSNGLYDPGSGNFSSSVLRLSPKAARLQDSFTPENYAHINAKDLGGSATPAIFPFAGRVLVAAIQKEGVLYLLDANNLGGRIGENHAKYVFKSPLLGNEAVLGTDPGQGVWGAVTTYLSPSGKRFIYAPMHGPPASTAPKFPNSAGAIPNGSIMAFEIVERNGAIVAEPRWTSNDLIMPDPPVVANGVLFATSTGGQAMQNPIVDGKRLANTTPESSRRRSTPVGNLTLYAYDAETGKRLYSSGKAIENWVHFSEPVVALGKVFLVTNDAQVIALGLR